MTRHLKTTSILILAILLLFINYSCTSDPKPSDETPDLVSSVEFKNKDNTVNIRLPAEPDRLNPVLTTNSYSRYIYSNIFLELLSYNPVSLKEEPVLVKAKPIANIITDDEGNEGVAYTYELLDNARWSDGQPLTATDVIFTYKAIFNVNVAEAAIFRAALAFISDIVADPANDKKFTVYTNEVYILAEASINSTAILPAHIFDPENLMADIPLADMIKDGEKVGNQEKMKAFAELFTSPPYSRDGDKLIGTGAYKVDKWDAGQSITMSKIDNWWAADGSSNLVAYPDQFVFKIIPDNTTAINALKGELIDISAQVDAGDFTELKSNEFMKSHYNFYTPDTYSYYYIAMNNGDPKLSDKRVRRALTHLTDIDFLINEQFNGLATPLNNTPVHPSKSYFDKDLKPIEYNVEKAKALLAEAGWKDSNANGIVDKEIDGKRVELELEYLVTPGSKFGNAMANLLKDNSAEAGIKINIIPMEMRALLGERVAQRKYDLFGLGAISEPVPDDFNQLWHTSSNNPRGTNRVQFGNAETDALIEKINRTLDENERAVLYKKFQEIIYDEQPMVFLFVPQERIIVSKRFEMTPTSLRPGFKPNRFKLLQ